ncbi:MAG: biotin--[acetyl-CoA-carboxylase] ligase [Gammaproteobacteria bacterium]
MPLRGSDTPSSRALAADASHSRIAIAADALLVGLADGRPHDVETLLAGTVASDVPPDAPLAELARRGLTVIRNDDGTIRLARPLDLLAADALLGRIPEAAARRIEQLELFVSLDSTNRRLLESEPPRPGAARICIAEYQHAGRGRRGRRWIVPPAAGVCLSAAWSFVEPPEALSALPLASGVAARRAIHDACGLDVTLKWPNDLVLDGGKLGGILVETVPRHAGGVLAVVGVGINVALPRDAAASSDWPGGAADLAGALGGVPPSRTELAAALIARLVEVLGGYAETGLVPYLGELRAADALEGRRIVVTDAYRETIGVAAGIDADGALLVADERGRCRRILAGDVTVRPA